MRPQKVGSRPMNDSELSRLRRQIIQVLVLLFGVECAASAFTSPWLHVRRVQLVGISGLTPAEVTLAQNAMQLPAKTNFFRVPIGSFTQSLKGLPCVQRVSVIRHFPSGIEARIVARQPIAILQMGEKLFEVDPTGVAIRVARPEVAARLPHVIASAENTPALGTVSGNLSVNTAVQIIESEKRTVSGGIAKIDVDSVGNLCLNMRDGVLIRLGLPDEMPAKLKQLHLLYRHSPDLAAKMTLVNLSVPDYPACVLRSDSAPPSNGDSL